MHKLRNLICTLSIIRAEKFLDFGKNWDFVNRLY